MNLILLIGALVLVVGLLLILGLSRYMPVAAAKREEKEVYKKRPRKHPLLRRYVSITSIVGMTVIILTFLIVLPTIVVFNPRSCSVCHSESHNKWMNSTHKNVKCGECHIQTDIRSTIQCRLGVLQKVAIKLNLVEETSKPVGFEARPSNETCDKCHKNRRTISPAGDLRIPHAAHIKIRKLKCVDCHTGLVHKSDSTKQSQQSMLSCYNCHDGKQAPNSCSACHTEKALPDDHRAPGWLETHGQTEQQNPEYCIECHGWVDDYCGECHQRKPRSHVENGNWRSDHQPLIVTDKKEGCSQCHGSQRCTSCHTRK